MGIAWTFRNQVMPGKNASNSTEYQNYLTNYRQTNGMGGAYGYDRWVTEGRPQGLGGAAQPGNVSYNPVAHPIVQPSPSGTLGPNPVNTNPLTPTTPKPVTPNPGGNLPTEETSPYTGAETRGMDMALGQWNKGNGGWWGMNGQAAQTRGGSQGRMPGSDKRTGFISAPRRAGWM